MCIENVSLALFLLTHPLSRYSWRVECKSKKKKKGGREKIIIKNTEILVKGIV